MFLFILKWRSAMWGIRFVDLISAIDLHLLRRGAWYIDGELFQYMNTRVPSEPILLTYEFEKLTIH